MKLFITLFTAFFACTSPLAAASNTFLDYQNYNHGYCPNCNCAPCKCGHTGGDQVPPPPGDAGCAKPNPCCPPATTCATECGISLWCIGIGLVAVVVAAVFIVGNHSGTVHNE